MPRPYRPKVRCSAKGGKCRRAAIRGGTVCQYHGGGAPQVKKAAQERLADLIDPDRALRTAAALAYSDIGDLYDDSYRLTQYIVWADQTLTRKVQQFDLQYTGSNFLVQALTSSQYDATGTLSYQIIEAPTYNTRNRIIAISRVRF